MITSIIVVVLLLLQVKYLRPYSVDYTSLKDFTHSICSELSRRPPSLLYSLHQQYSQRQ